MATFKQGAILGLLFGTVLTVINRRQDAASHISPLQTAKTTAADVKAVQDAAKRVKTAMAALQQAKTNNVDPFTDDMAEMVRAYEFKLAPHLEKLNASLAKINTQISQSANED